VIAARAVSGAPPDGSTLLIYSVIFLITKNVQPSLAFDPLADFAPVAKIYGEGASLLMATRAATSPPRARAPSSSQPSSGARTTSGARS
jgi:tripartite-type tricarboxylate transporter receptor subunit TctC